MKSPTIQTRVIHVIVCSVCGFESASISDPCTCERQIDNRPKEPSIVSEFLADAPRSHALELNQAPPRAQLAHVQGDGRAFSRRSIILPPSNAPTTAPATEPAPRIEKEYVCANCFDDDSDDPDYVRVVERGTCERCGAGGAQAMTEDQAANQRRLQEQARAAQAMSFSKGFREDDGWKP